MSNEDSDSGSICSDDFVIVAHPTNKEEDSRCKLIKLQEELDKLNEISRSKDEDLKFLQDMLKRLIKHAEESVRESKEIIKCKFLILFNF